MVALAGPIMNVLTAMAIPFAVRLCTVFRQPVAVVYYVQQVAPQISRSSSRRSHHLVQRHENPSWDVITGDALLSPGRPLPVVVNRNGQEVSLTITPTTHTENGEAAVLWISFLITVVCRCRRQVNPGSPAEARSERERSLYSIGGET
jgi:hypothetical protein